jgi:hypothetical protein
LSLRAHHSFVALPEPGYTPRREDPRVGFFSLAIDDYASPFTEPLEQRWLHRHRLLKRDPTAPISEPDKPIVYFVDPGVPEPIRSALVEGASWWVPAFEAAGFRRAFLVKVLPEDADPLDIRYNVITWVHRSTPGWSWGNVVVDPRTGEIIKAVARIGSLRIREDLNMARGLVPQYAGQEPGSAAALALARIRLLAAHEVGHTLGLAHNMAGSSSGQPSVMDYTAPRVGIKNGALDLSEAYAAGVGAYDRFAIQFAYAEFPRGSDERTELARMVACANDEPSCPEKERIRPPLLYVSDDDARPTGGAHPHASVFDNGSDPIQELAHEMEVRRIALDSFGLGNLAPGEPLSALEEMLVPVLLHHRFQLEAALKSLGGLDYAYTVKEGSEAGPVSPRIVPAPQQREALRLALMTLAPSFLAVPRRILRLLPPRPAVRRAPEFEVFENKTLPTFDPVAAAAAVADVTLGALLEPHRLARLARFSALDPANPGLEEVFDSLVELAASTRFDDGYFEAIARAERSLVVGRLMDLATDPDADSEVRDASTEALRALSTKLAARSSAEAGVRVVQAEIERFLERPWDPGRLPAPPEVPFGGPIGD